MPDSHLSSVDRLIRQLQLEQLDKDLFLGDPGPGMGRLFGGMVAAQAVMAASNTVEPEKGNLHSLHAYFLRPGSHTAPIRYTVYRIRDGRTFTSRDVVAYQGGEAIFSISTSFAVHEEGMDYQGPIPAAPAPGTLPNWEDVMREEMKEEVKQLGDAPTRWMRLHPIETKHAYPPKGGAAPGELPSRKVWIRPKGELPPDPRIHTAFLVFASDSGLLGTIAWGGSARPPGPQGGRGNPMGYQRMAASLDHSVWVHRTPNWDDWLLYHSESPVGFGARGLIFGGMYHQDGTRVVSVAQEGLVRDPRGRAAPKE
ncbi:MAG: thioesterase family protein [Dehalococcoidia bacterium]|nr:thioesterase family protein [Dehalococcoidia bacterium]